jgi:hypothetical protein
MRQRLVSFILAIVLFLPEISRVVKWIFRQFERLLQLGEHIEFIAHHLGDVRRVAEAIEKLPQLPEWISLPLMGLGFGVIWWDRRRQRRYSAITTESVSVSTLPQPNIDARAAFFQILKDSKWTQEQIAKTLDTSQLIYNWLEVRLDDEIHKALISSKLDSWGEEILPNGAIAPERQIPAKTWREVEIMFDRADVPRTAAHWRASGRERGRMAWVGIRFSKEQTFMLFPLVQHISLTEAVTRAHEQLRYTPIAVSTEAFADSPDDILIAYCDLLVRPRPDKKQTLLTIHGIMPPARIAEPIDMSVYSHFAFAFIDGVLVLQEQHRGKRNWTSLSVNPNELARVVDEWRHWGE